MWVLTGERERFCGIHISGKSIRIVDDAASRRVEHLFDTLETCPLLTNCSDGTPSITAPAGGGNGKPLDYGDLERWTRVGFERGTRSRHGER